MSNEVIVTLIVAIFGSTGLFTFLQFIINLVDKRRAEKRAKESNELTSADKALEEVKLIKHDMKELRKDTIRTQLMMLMTDYPSQHNEIMTIAEYYFNELGGNWYCSELFQEWLDAQGLKKPAWFK